MASDDIQILKIKGKLMWPKLFHPDTYYEDRWTIDLLLDAAGITQAQENGLRIKRLGKDGKAKYDGQFEGFDGSFLTMDRAVLDPKTKEDRDGPVVKDNKLSDVSADTGIGNGTDAMARCILKTRDKNGSPMSIAEAQKQYGGYGMFLTGVQILNLVPYERSGDPDSDFVEEEGSFSAETGDSGFEVEQTDAPFDVDEKAVAG